MIFKLFSTLTYIQIRYDAWVHDGSGFRYAQDQDHYLKASSMISKSYIRTYMFVWLVAGWL